MLAADDTEHIAESQKLCRLVSELCRVRVKRKLCVNVSLTLSGKGVIAREDIAEGDFITYYSGKRLLDEPDESVDDSYIFEIQLNRKKIW